MPRTSELAARLHDGRAATAERFSRRLREVVPEYYGIGASDFQDAGWSALLVVIDGAVRALTADEVWTGLPGELVAEASAAARHGLSWELLARTYRLTHQVLWEQVITELAGLRLPRSEDALLLREASDRLFTYFDRLTVDAAEVYARARPDARRDPRLHKLVKQLLDGVKVPESELGYPLSGRHVAVIAWGVDEWKADALVVNAGEEIWAWFAQPEDEVRKSLGTGRYAIGQAAPGRTGFVTSHRQARLVASLWARKLIVPQTPAVTYGEVALLAVALENEDTARAFAEHELRALPGQRSLRETLVAYARSGLNARITARTLGVSERTVRYRLEKLEELLGSGFRARLPELVTAVSVAEALERQRNTGEG